MAIAPEKTVTRKDIAAGFAGLGLGSGEILLLHSSLRSLGHVRGGAETVIDGILDVLGPEGTLLAPTLTGSEDLSPANPPRIDLRTTPCWTGAIPEALRMRLHAQRSIHPTHSCAALGKRADELTHGHYFSTTPCGITSPYFKAAATGGFIAMLGCALDVCTTFHTVEELADVDYHLQPEATYGYCIDASGNAVKTPCRLHRYDGPERDFPVMEPILLEQGLMQIGKVGPAAVRLINAMGLIEATLARLRADPYYITALRGRRPGS